MRYYNSATLKETLTDFTVDELNTLIRYLPITKRPKRKADIVREFLKFYTKSGIEELLGRTTSQEKLALMETAHSDSHMFNDESFEAKYGKLPDLGRRLYEYRYKSQKGELPILRLFYLRNEMLPSDLKVMLKELLPEPEEFSLKVTQTIPASIACKGYSANEKDSEVQFFSAESTVHADIDSVLRLIDAGKISVGEKTKIPSASSLRKISEALVDPDYLANCEEPNKWEKLTPIRPFAWVMLILSARLAKPFGKTLQLTKAGQQAIASDQVAIRKQLFDSWITASFDEVMRNDNIKGKTGKGKASLSKPSGRRRTIVSFLKECPVEKWVHIDDFSSLLRANGETTFVPLDECWPLYISNQEYGSLGYNGTNFWALLDGPWLRCLLMEYFATLGIVDIAYVDPNGARDDYTNHWGADDLSFMMQHDGLLYFKLTKFGAYCVGLTNSHDVEVEVADPLFVATSNLQLSVLDGGLPLGDKMLIELYCTQVSDVVWKLDEKKILDQLEVGRSIDHLVDYLNSRVKNAFPATMKRFIEDIQSRAEALSNSGSASVIQCKDANLAKLLANDSKTKKFCFLADGGRLVIPYGMEKKFRSGVKKLGYFLPN